MVAIFLRWVSEWLFLTPKVQVSSYIMEKTLYIQWNENNDICYLLDQHA